MPVLELCFPAGRYHATTWGRNVNEGEPEWPPSPFRLARALLDIRYRRHDELSEEVTAHVLSLLAGRPRFSLPPVSTMAVKCYLDQNQKELDKQPVLDAFVCMEKHAALYMELPQDASEESLNLLAELVTELNYLGRSESWVSARLCDTLPADRVWNCIPAAPSDQEEEHTILQTLLSPEQYEALPFQPLKKQGRKKIPCSWLESLSISTSRLQSEGWNRHPLLGRCVYSVSPAAPLPVHAGKEDSEEAYCVTYALCSKPLPPVTHALPLAERLRAGVMSRHRQLCGNNPARLSPLFSGKDGYGNPLKGHRHAFFWPRDIDGDGKIDHVHIWLPRPATPEERMALENLRHVWTSGAELAELVFLHCVPQQALPAAHTVVSATPVVFGRHYNPRKGSHMDWLNEEIRRACREQGLPEPDSIKAFPVLPIRDGAPLPWNSFIRQRKDKPSAPGYGFRLHFASPVRVPFALGSLAHFGMGLFVKERSSEALLSAAEEQPASTT